jgi:protein involved in polysaccharide export with SLBB domain
VRFRKLRSLLSTPAAAPAPTRWLVGTPLRPGLELFSVPGLRELVSVVLLTLAPGIALAQSGPNSADSAQASSSGLGPGDLILLKIWREPDLSDSVQVDNAGLAVFPKLGPIKVTDISPDSLERLLVHDYSRYLQNPSIKVTVLRRITIWGAVIRPGAYPVDLTMTITDALSLAGGVTAEGKSDKVELLRGSKRYTVDLSGGIQKGGELSLRSGDQLVVPQRSWVSRNPGLIMGAIGTITSVVWLVSRN